MKKKASPDAVFFVVIGVLLCVFISQIYLFAPVNVWLLLFPAPNDSFMDFFNVLASVGSGYPYECGGLFLYPPFTGLLILCFTPFIPASLMDSLRSGIVFGESNFSLVNQSAYAIKESPYGMLALAIFMAVSIVLAAVLITAVSKGTFLKRFCVLMIMLLSAPFLFEYQRGNTILLAVIFLLFFLHFKDSPSPLLRELALISLACAAGIKIYPALFGLLLLREKRWLDSFKAVCYGLIVMFVPFVLFGGSEALFKLLETLRSSTETTYGQGLYYQVSLTNFLRVLGMQLGWPDLSVISCGKIVSYLLLALSVPAVILSGKQWKAIAVITFAIILVPGFNFYYALCYAVIPILFFLNEGEKGPVGYLFAVGFALLLSPVYLGVLHEIQGVSVGLFPLTVATVIQSGFCIILDLILIFEALILLRSRREPAVELK